VLFAVHTVFPVNGFEAQEFTGLRVATSVFVILVPSTFTTPIPFVAFSLQLLLGT
jgi:hypothetical protein